MVLLRWVLGWRQTSPVMTASLNKASSVTMEAYSWPENLERLILSLANCNHSRRTTMSNTGWHHVMSSHEEAFSYPEPQYNVRNYATLHMYSHHRLFHFICHLCQTGMYYQPTLWLRVLACESLNNFTWIFETYWMKLSRRFAGRWLGVLVKLWKVKHDLDLLYALCGESLSRRLK